MPAVAGAALVAGIGAGIAAGSTAAAIGFSATAFFVAAGTSLALAGISNALREEPDLPRNRQLGEGLQVSTLAPAQPRRILYGRNRVGGQIVMRAATGEQNSEFHQIVVWAGHEVEAIESVYGDDEIMPGAFASVTASDIYFEDLGDEIKSVTTDLEAVFPESGTVIKAEGSAGQDGMYRIKTSRARDIAPHELNVVRLDSGGFGDTTPGPSITLTEVYSRVHNHLGSDAQPADATATLEIPPWTSNHTLSGCAYTYATLYYSQKHWKGGLPNHTAIIQGKKVFDPRSGTTGYTRNPALICADWLTDTTYGLAVPYANLNETSLIDAANVCDENVTTSAGTVNRYSCDAVISADEDRRDVLHRIAASMAGHVVQTGAQWTFKAGAFEMPTFSLDESDLRGPVQITPRRSRQELFNSVKAGYRDATLDWQPTDMPHIQDQGAIAQDNGEALWRTLRYDYTTDRETVQRLAKIELLRNRQHMTLRLRVGLSALALTAGSTVSLSIDRYGWVGKPFFVEKWGLAQYADENGEPALGVDLTLAETSADVFAWASGEGSPTPSPDALPIPEWATMEAPSILALASGGTELLTAGDGTLISRIKATWELSAGALASRFDLRYRRASDSEWSYITTTSPTAWIAPVDDGAQYDIHVRAVNALGVPSPWTQQNGYLVIGKTAAPGDVTGFTASAARDRIGLAWTANPEADISHYLIREGASWDSATPVARTDATAYQTAGPSNGPWWIKAVDTSGNLSAAAAQAIISPVLPSVTSITGQVVDNNVLLRWSVTPGTFDIQTYEVRKGADAATAVGDSDKTFDVVFEMASGTYTYHIVPIDAAGNEGTADSITLSVDSPPDFILRNSFKTDWEGYTATSVQPLFSVPLPARLTTRDQMAIDGDGVDDYVEVPDSATIDITGSALTIEALVYFKAAGINAFLNRENAYELQRDSNGNLGAAIQTSAAWQWVDSGLYIPLGRIVYIAVVYDGIDIRFHVDAESASVAHPDGGAVNSQANALHYLCRNPGTAHQAMRMAELRLWDVARTSTQINDHRARTLDGNESNLMLYHRLQSGATETVADKSGNGNDGSVVGASWHEPSVRAVIPFPSAETVADREGVHGYTTPQAQIDAGYTYVAQPVPSTATYEEIYDAGVVIPSTRINVTLSGSDLVAGVTSEITISTRESEGDPWTDHPAGLDAVFVASFRYVKVKVVYSSDGSALRDAQDIMVVLSTKIKNDAGKVTVSANPTTVTLGVDFVDIEGITATPQGTLAKIAIVDFNDAPNPTEFDLYLFHTDGTAATGDVHWSARGF